MQAGQTAHSQWQNERLLESEGFQKEVPISYATVISGWEVVVSGRMDGLSFDNGVWTVEELKSSTLPLSQLAELQLDSVPSWRRQVELYLFFLFKQGKIAKGRLVIISLADGSLATFDVPHNPDLEAYISSQIAFIISEHETRLTWLSRRHDAVVKGIPFPFPSYRKGQAEMVRELEDALAEEKQILLHAPTGYGKTAAALYAALQVAYRAGVSVFFATARTTQQIVVEDTVAQLSDLGVPIRGISIRAKEKICLNEQVNCRPDSCRYAAQYHDKIRANNTLAMSWEMGHERGGAWPDDIVQLGETQEVCPYAVSIDLAAQADVVIGDYNYLFSPSSRLNLIDSQPKQWIVIVDEVHNLPDRAMGYGSPKLSLLHAWRAFRACDESMLYRPYAEPMRQLTQWLQEVCLVQTEAERATLIEDSIQVGWIAQLAQQIEGLALEYATQKIQYPLFGPDEGDPWTETAFALLHFHQALTKAGEETVVIWHHGALDRLTRSKAARKARKRWGKEAPSIDTNTGVQLLCRDPVKLLASHFKACFGAICMSATAQPFDFYHDLLGLNTDRAVRISYPSPFPPKNSLQLIVGEVSTAYRDRDRDRERTAELIGDAVVATPGNVAVYFPSFKMMSDTLPHLYLDGRAVLMQQPRMTDVERNDMLEVMRRGEGHVLLAVLGGIFSEGVDLPAEALRCAIVVGPSLPQASLSRRLLQEWYQERYQKGFQYAWLVPGMARVGQAAGRVIRGPTDTGTIVLIGQRFLRSEYQACLPTEWTLIQSQDISADVNHFWGIVSSGLNKD